KLTMAEERDLAAWLGGMNFDLAIDLRWHPQTRHVLRLSGARHAAGYGNGDEYPWLTLALPYDAAVPAQRPRRHIAQELIDLVEVVATAYEAADYPRLESLRQERIRVDRLLTRVLPADSGLVVGIHPGAGMPIKCWPAEHFARLADLMMERLDARIVLF